MKEYKVINIQAPDLTDGGVRILGSMIGIYDSKPIPRSKLTAGGFGAVYSKRDPPDHDLYISTVERSMALGRALAKKEIIGLNGATAAIPHQYAQGFKDENGIVVGFAAVGNPQAHEADVMKTYHNLRGRTEDARLVNSWDANPFEPYNMLFFFNLTHRDQKKNFLIRDIFLAESSDIGIIMDGRYGALHEGVAKREIGKGVIGVLKESGGISEKAGEILQVVEKENGIVIVEDQDPIKLADEVERAALELREKEIISPEGNEVFYRFVSQAETLMDALESRLQ